MGNNKKRILAAVLSAAMILTMQPVVYAEEEATETADSTATTVSAADDEGEEEVSTITNIMSTGDRENAYSAYYERHNGKTAPDKEIVIDASTGVTGADIEGEVPEYTIEEYEKVENCFVWTNNRGTVTFDFTVEETGIYNMEFLYYTIAGASTTIDVGIRIDGEYPFTACKDITLDRYWKDASAIRKDSKDNELKPTQIEKDKWVTYTVKDKEGLFNDPYIFFLEAGDHTLTLEGIRTNIALKSITFKNYEDLPAYVKASDADISATPALTNENDIGSKTILIQAETPLEKTASTLYATYDRTSYLTNPSHPTKQRYNTLGSGTWDQATQAVTWTFTVPADGYYNFAFKARQNTMRGFYSNRRIYIDGVVPNKLMDIVSFPYDPNWYVQNLKDSEGRDMFIYLTAGEHTITMEVVPGSIGEIMRRLDELVYTLNYYYRRILMITGPDPDEYNDYLVDIQIPELIPTFESAIETLYAEKANIEKLGQGSEASSLESLAVILQRCCDERDEIPQMVGTLKDYISSVSAWMRDYRDQPLELDYIEVRTVNEKASSAKGNFFEDFAFGFQAFIGSFFEDYTQLSDTTEKSINTWVALGRDQATVVKDLVDNDFNQNNSGINVSINLVPGGILEATLAGKGPDVALFLGGDFPIQCAARDLIVDISKFNDFEDVVSQRFTDSITTLYTYRDGVYGLPVSQTFPMMFYRTDILEELGVKEIPETWEELIDIIPVLQRSYLTVGLLSPASNLSSSIFESGDTFSMLVLQTGNNMYNKELTKTTYDQKIIVDAFKQWTDFYTIYDFEQTYDAFSRFRTGEMPIVIQNYTFFNQLTVSAPEIKGLWDFTLVPGTEVLDENGNKTGVINHAANSSSSGAVIFNKCADVNAAWEFIKWFTSDEVQTQYGRTIEGQMGQMGRYDTANVNALSQIPWSSSEYEKISAQMNQTVEIPIIPASYATTRHVKNAFRAVVNDTWNPRYALSSYNRDINSEIERKNQDLATFGK